MSENLKLKKSLGQNFIQSSDVVWDIINAIDPDPETFVLEIGPGAGALTIPLSESTGHLTAVELDPRMVMLLRSRFEGNNKVDIVADDILQCDIKKLLSERNAGDYKHLKIAGNIPYNITSPIITMVLESGIPFESFTIMIQKEVADRICSMPGKRTYGYMSVMVQYYTQTEYIRTVGRELFMPPPNVDSAVVNLHFRNSPAVDCDREQFFNIAKASFAHKRKTLANNLQGFAGADKQMVSELLGSAGIEPSRRAETLSLEEFARITDAFYNRRR